jgi:hypothetical protein
VIIGEAGEAARAIWGDLGESRGRVYGGGGGGGGSFKMDPQELATVIGQWEDLKEKLTADGMLIDQVANSLGIPPGGDAASGSYVSSGLDSILALKAQNDSMKDYVENYIKKLNVAKSGTVATDQDLSSSFKLEA